MDYKESERAQYLVAMGNSDSEKVCLFVKLVCAEGKNDDLDAAIRGLVEAADIEPDLEVYAGARGADNTYWFFEIYASEEAFAAHGKSDEMRAAMKAVGVCLAAPPEVNQVSLLAAKGV